MIEEREVHLRADPTRRDERRDRIRIGERRQHRQRQRAAGGARETGAVARRILGGDAGLDRLHRRDAQPSPSQTGRDRAGNDGFADAGVRARHAKPNHGDCSSANSAMMSYARTRSVSVAQKGGNT